MSEKKREKKKGNDDDVDKRNNGWENISRTGAFRRAHECSLKKSKKNLMNFLFYD